MNTFLKNQNKPILVGLTGGIGSGKSTVAKIFNSLGVPIFNSDAVAKEIINHDVDVIKQIKAEFGEIYDSKKLNAKKMAQIVFKDKKELEKLNSIIHPKVKEHFEHWINENSNSPILIKEAAILIESEAYKEMDKIILVIAPVEERIRRVMERDHVLSEQVGARLEVQLSDEEKQKYAQFIITNDGKELVIPQVLKVYNQLKKP